MNRNINCSLDEQTLNFNLKKITYYNPGTPPEEDLVYTDDDNKEWLVAKSYDQKIIQHYPIRIDACLYYLQDPYLVETYDSYEDEPEVKINKVKHNFNIYPMMHFPKDTINDAHIEKNTYELTLYRNYNQY